MINFFYILPLIYISYKITKGKQKNKIKTYQLYNIRLNLEFTKKIHLSLIKYLFLHKLTTV